MFVCKCGGRPLIRDLQDRPGVSLFVYKLNLRIIVVGNAKRSGDPSIAAENCHALEISGIRGRERNAGSVLAVVES